MKICTAHLRSISAYSQSRKHDTPKLDSENPDDYERRTWREKAHVDRNGMIFIPPMAFKQCIDSTAKYLGMQIPGKGKSTYTKHFLAGVLCMDRLTTQTAIADCPGEWISANADGVRGSGKRVQRCFPTIQTWEGAVDFYILDETITRKVFEETLRKAGQFRGIGRFRPENGGFYGRFEVLSSEWRDG